MPPGEWVLGLAAAATAGALLYPPAARLAWAGAAIAVAGWAVTQSVPAGVVLVASVAAATFFERGEAPAAPGFNSTMARLAALGGAAAASLVVTVRVLLVDLVDGAQTLTLVAVGLAAVFYLLVHAGFVEESRAARLALVVAASGWVAGNHPGIVVPLGAAALMILMAVAPRRLVPS
ncbi:MAG: hypothetical protein ACR2MY_15725 [Candidatus Dormibacteria bacterium]